MIYLILCIISSTGIFIVFKTLDKKNIPPYPVILINYIVASCLGFLINAQSFVMNEIVTSPWMIISTLIGFLFIVMFFLVAKSSGEAGISITTVASKMSVIFPIALSILLEREDHLTFLKAIAISAALIGVLFTIYEPGKLFYHRNRIFLPLVLFFGMGIVDSLVKFAQHTYVGDADIAIFSAVLFAMAFFTGLIILPFRKQGLKEFTSRSVIIAGLILGIVNFGSVYLMISALNYTNSKGLSIDSSIIFGANNIGIVSLSVLSGLLIFKEKLRAINWTGIIISASAILLFTLT